MFAKANGCRLDLWRDFSRVYYWDRYDTDDAMNGGSEGSDVSPVLQAEMVIRSVDVSYSCTLAVVLLCSSVHCP